MGMQAAGNEIIVICFTKEEAKKSWIRQQECIPISAATCLIKYLFEMQISLARGWECGGGCNLVMHLCGLSGFLMGFGTQGKAKGALNIFFVIAMVYVATSKLPSLDKLQRK